MTVDSDSILGNGKIFPPGFRFHPTDEELVLYYLKKKICCKRHRMDVIAEVDVYKWDPEDLPEMSKLKTGDRQWFFFSPRDRKYPNGARSNRGTAYGYWKATGKDRVISNGSRDVGLKKTLVFYRGRAPSGLRTDWVMHEYTMDEEELKRCNNIQDYYALYKVYKKSGPGPKNGEQYGAPFREEDWADDDVDVLCIADGEKELVHVTETAERQNVTSLDDLERILNSLEDDDVEPISAQPFAGDSFFALEEFALTENDPSMDVPFPLLEPNNRSPFDLLQPSNAPQLQFLEVSHSQVTSEPLANAEDLLEAEEEDFLKDYLEMDDLITSTPNNTDKQLVDDLGTNLFDEIDGLSEFDLYQETPHFFTEEAAPIEPGLFLHDYDNGTANQLLPPLNNSDLINWQMWDDQGSVLTSADDANHSLFSASAPGTLDQNHGSKQDNGATDSWFSSALWSFVESIPSSPASASEIALVNKAFERMSSFSRVRLNERSQISAAVSNNSSAVSTSSRKSRRNFICFSVLGLVCAVLWTVLR